MQKHAKKKRADVVYLFIIVEQRGFNYLFLFIRRVPVAREEDSGLA